MRFNKKWKKVLQPDKGKYGIYKKAGIVLLLSIVMFSAVYVTDNHRQLAQDENGNRILERKGQGEGKKTEKIQMETGEWKEKMKVQISEKKYAKEEIGEQLSKAAEELPAQILGENKSLDEVRSDLNLIMEIPHTGISVSWELDNYEVMNSRGVLKQEKLTEEGTLVKLTAVLRYDEEKMSCEFYAHLFSIPLSKKEGVLKKISQEVEKADQEQREKDYLILPDQVDGRKLSWKPVKEMRAFGILLLTIEELRKHCGYDMESNTYDSGTFFYRGTSPFGEVVDYLDNSDGTLTLYVDAVWPDRNTDCAFKNEIVIKPYGDGTCQYLSNKVQKIELDIPVYEEY